MSMDISLLQNIQDISLQDYINAASVPGNTVGEQYYNALKGAANSAGLTNVQNYADLATGVATNSGINGVLANNFFNSVAIDKQITFMAESQSI